MWITVSITTGGLGYSIQTQRENCENNSFIPQNVCQTVHGDLTLQHTAMVKSLTKGPLWTNTVLSNILIPQQSVGTIVLETWFSRYPMVSSSMT